MGGNGEWVAMVNGWRAAAGPLFLDLDQAATRRQYLWTPADDPALHLAPPELPPNQSAACPKTIVLKAARRADPSWCRRCLVGVPPKASLSSYRQMHADLINGLDARSLEATLEPEFSVRLLAPPLPLPSQ